MLQDGTEWDKTQVQTLMKMMEIAIGGEVNDSYEYFIFHWRIQNEGASIDDLITSLRENTRHAWSTIEVPNDLCGVWRQFEGETDAGEGPDSQQVSVYVSCSRECIKIGQENWWCSHQKGVNAVKEFGYHARGPAGSKPPPKRAKNIIQSKVLPSWWWELYRTE